MGDRLDAAVATNTALASDLARLLSTIDAVPGALEALGDELGAQSDVILAQYNLLRQVQADLERLQLAASALAPAIVQGSERVIAVLEERADRSDARLDQVLAELRALRDQQRQGLVSFAGAQTGDVTFTGDIAAGDIHKPVLGPGGIYAPGGTVIQPFTPRPVTATAEELYAAEERLVALPTDVVPEPQDVLPRGSWMGNLTRNHQFVGRVGDLLALARALKGGQSVTVSQGQSAVASGLGGIGKTQLAIEFAYRYGQYFAGVFWLSFAQPDAIPAEIARCGGAGRLQLFTEAAGLSLDEQVALVRVRWACGLPYLLILDNCEDLELARVYHPGGAARVLITSRRGEWPGDLGMRQHALGVLARGESIALLHQHRPELSDEDANALADELGDLPLALHLAGTFLAGPGRRLAVERYLIELQSPRIFERLPVREQDGSLPTGHSRDVARTFALSYERLDPQQAEDALALSLLARAAHLVPGEVVPTELLLATLDLPDDDLDAELAAEQALDRLVRLGLLEREGSGGVRMHRLVGVYVRQVSGDTEAQSAVEQAVLRVAQQLIDAPTLASLSAFLPILRGVTIAAVVREDRGAATFCIWLGHYLNRLGSYAIAQPYLERALALCERILGPEHPDTATSLNNLAELHQRQGNYEAARPLFERALDLHERILGPEHPDTATSLNNLAGLHQRQGNYEAARPLLERALALREHILGPEHPDTATSLNNLALLHYAQGNYDLARPLYERALTLRERVLGPEHPDTATCLNNLARLYRDHGDYEAARPLLERALALRERVLGPEHPDTATCLNNLAINHYYQGDLPTAERLSSRALTIGLARLGPAHPATQTFQQTLASIRQRRVGTSTQPASPADPAKALVPLLNAIATIAGGNEELRPAVEQILTQLEQQGRMLRVPVKRMWAGERDRNTLVVGLDDLSTTLVDLILAVIVEGERQT